MFLILVGGARMNKKFFSLLFSMFLLTGCSGSVVNNKSQNVLPAIDEEGKISKPLDIDTDILDNPNTKYDHSSLLVKSSASSESEVLTKDMMNLGITSIKSIAPNSNWKKITLKDGMDAKSSIKKIRKSKLFDMVDFDYIYDTDEVGEPEGITSSIPNEIADYQKQVNVDKAWEWLEQNGHEAGGDSSVIVAVIDTGVDYNHIDLKQNIWINKAETPDNGIDDDNNGYVDDVYGWNFVGNNNNPMDDNGHGTHVAGIIGAANNGIGVTGVAYNCKIMPVKAGNSSGYFNNSDIASAITYAYMNGADVINMSFGGTTVTMAVQEALEKAYTTSLLVAAAGNDCAQNELVYPLYRVETIYPASYSFVDGVMSVNSSSTMSSFTNFDSIAENKIEYECLAPGELINSTFPNNRYASLSGTSMATPVVSGIGALLRSAVKDKNEYPTKFLLSQINNTSTTGSSTFIGGPIWNGKAMVVDALKALTGAPKPRVSLYDRYTFDGTNISSNNNGNDNIDAGETIHIGVELMNRGGMAKDVTATIDVNRNGMDDIVDPYVDITTPSVNFSNIGTYSIRDGGKIMGSDTIIDVEKPFVFEVSNDAPNHYRCDINIHISWKNGLDDSDTNVYSTGDVMSVAFHQGETIPTRIDIDTTLTADKLWIVNDTVKVGEGVTLTIEPGTTIQFYEQNQSKYQYAAPKILLKKDSELICEGTEEEMINFTLAEDFVDYAQFLDLDSNVKNISLKYVNMKNFTYSGLIKANRVSISHCSFDYWCSERYSHLIVDGEEMTQYNFTLTADLIEKSSFRVGNYGYVIMDITTNSLISSAFILNKTRKDTAGFLVHSSIAYNNVIILQDSGSYQLFNARNADGEIVSNNSFINNSSSNNFGDFPKVSCINASNNNFYGYPEPFIDRTFGDTKNEITGTSDISDIWPYISGYQFTNDKGEETNKFSNENMNLKLYFNRSMNINEPLSVKFGSVEPHGDYIIEGNWIDEYTWQGKRQIPTAIENGTQRLNISGGRAKDDHYLTNQDNGFRITFDIDTTNALAMNMFANPTKDGIQLEMKQNDYDTVMGYNIYRSETKDGEYARINTSVIRPEEGSQDATYLDNTVEPGKTYYYSYTAVMTDFSESHASGRTTCTALDTINPIVSHTPVNQGYLMSNLNINCVIQDNVKVEYAKLFYRAKGSENYKFVTMVNTNDKYTGIIPANDLSIAGMEYYIETSDGTNITTLGTKDEPYRVDIKESSAVSYLGDVDGNGVIEAVDAMLVLQHINGKRVLVNDEFRRADLNKNSILESFEALAILQYVNGNRTNLDL